MAIALCVPVTNSSLVMNKLTSPSPKVMKMKFDDFMKFPCTFFSMLVFAFERGFRSRAVSPTPNALKIRKRWITRQPRLTQIHCWLLGFYSCTFFRYLNLSPSFRITYLSQKPLSSKLSYEKFQSVMVFIRSTTLLPKNPVLFTSSGEK